jgi:hypothetical protein
MTVSTLLPKVLIVTIAKDPDPDQKDPDPGHKDPDPTTFRFLTLPSPNYFYFFLFYIDLDKYCNSSLIKSIHTDYLSISKCPKL